MKVGKITEITGINIQINMEELTTFLLILNNFIWDFDTSKKETYYLLRRKSYDLCKSLKEQIMGKIKED